jgi:hypothetical protein
MSEDETKEPEVAEETTEETKEPVGLPIKLDNGILLATVYGDTEEEALLNRDRIVTCVTACGELSTDALKKGVLEQMLKVTSVTSSFVTDLVELFPTQMKTPYESMDSLMNDLKPAPEQEPAEEK